MKLHSPALALLLAHLCWMAGPAAGDNVPDPVHVNVLPADILNGPIIAPSDPAPIPQSIETVIVRNAQNLPVPNAAVEFLFLPGAGICTGAVHHYGRVHLRGRVAGTAGNVCSTTTASPNPPEHPRATRSRRPS